MGERRSYRGLAGSTALHGALLALIVLGFASAPKFADSPEAIPIETITLSDLNQVTNGEKEAKPAPQPPPTPPTPPEPPQDLRAAEEPAPDAANETGAGAAAQGRADSAAQGSRGDAAAQG